MCRERTAPVHKIISFSSVDGPGNRCAIFFQGCGFHCLYCHNPETIQLCSNCGVCVSHCPTGALAIGDGQVVWNPTLCCDCETCTKICPRYSSPRVRKLTVEEIMEEVRPLLPFISGITVSGGECTRQHKLLVPLFGEIHRCGKTAFVDTNGQLSFAGFPRLTEAMDKAMLDVKSVVDEEHQMLTGGSVDVVLENMEYLAKTDKLYEIRTVIVPGLLDNERTVRHVAGFLKDYPQIRYKLIAYRPFGVRPAMDVVPPGIKEMERMGTLAASCGAKQIVIT